MAQVAGFPDHLSVLKQLGKGSYGSVYLCEDRKRGKKVAAKHIRKATHHGRCILREVVLLARLKHENLVSLVDFVQVPSPEFQDVILVVPYMATDLHKVIHSGQDLTEKHIQVIICQILRGLTYLHAAGVAHRDLKPANVLLSKDCQVKICDFGLARGDMEGGDISAAGECAEFTEYVVTRWYRAPEVMLLPKKYTPAVDLWSVGCIIAEMINKKPLFPGRNHIDMICRISAVCGSPTDVDIAWVPEESEARRFLKRICPPGRGQQIAGLLAKASRACIDLTENLLGWDPAKRLSAKKAQEHDYLKNLLPKVPPVDPEPFDWAFDKFKPTVQHVQERLYAECARLHPEIVARDYSVLVQRGFFRDGNTPEVKNVAPGKATRSDVSPRVQRPIQRQSSQVESNVTPRSVAAAAVPTERMALQSRQSTSHSNLQSQVSASQRQSSKPPSSGPSTVASTGASSGTSTSSSSIVTPPKMSDVSPARPRPSSFQPPVRTNQGYCNQMIPNNRTPPRMRPCDRLFRGPQPIPAMASVQG
eukprot:gnl/MRDRNA2_/MRDRNA2_113672_c0_seq1.p1 gnl/MRDRNA2_/MRDRNA2_113672_c0~~gnl/MRDRNA2_/MRDRNA2_113672_c0_seq1.p1  ORF type:complete len:533 (-),score=89.00 gnl/MRDRNA2_/MRDRNA2_113672_c0_seq1:221-1819(-)